MVQRSNKSKPKIVGNGCVKLVLVLSTNISILITTEDFDNYHGI